MADSKTLTNSGRGLLLLLAAALLWSTSGLFVKSPPIEQLPEAHRGMLLAFYRALFAGLCLAPFVRRRHVRWRRALVPMALVFAVMNVLFLTAMTKTSAAATVFLQYTSTVWTCVLGFLVLGERVHRGNVVALVAAIAGIVWIVACDRDGQHVTGNLIALGSGLSYAGVILFLRFLRTENSTWLIALNHLVTALILAPWMLPLRIELSPIQWLVVALMGVLQMGIPYLLFARGVALVKAQEAALIPLLEPILNPLWVYLFWGETAEPSTWIGGGLIVGGLGARYLFFSTHEPVPSGGGANSARHE